ncbi:hypothetical protein [Novosphingobium sp. KACC 22771]|uniref:hypothetical protein n=1 Tax=Novosphingobium sp. KACC 22771 TaxID=3025670 RepID=UPI0023651CE5|nr:hypothetical protein [Novosphingobium sp. KACC 22771]WDF73675.1 hypothetical protein PQ467_06440 [Novosphingobium sp. KACC 22771]
MGKVEGREGNGRGAVRCDSVRPGRRTSRVAFRGEEPVEGDPLLGFAPYIHKAPRSNSITPDRQRAFIAALAASGIVTQAARVIGASLEALYKIRNAPGAEGFAAAWEEAVDRGMARLEDCALERAIAGEERFIVRHGEVVASWRRYDTPLLMFLLRNRRRDRYDAYGARGGERPLSAAEERARAIEEEREAEEVLESINMKLERMRERWLAAQEARREEEDADEVPHEDVVPTEEAQEAGDNNAGGEQTGGEDAGRAGIRHLPDLLREGDEALGLARYHRYARAEARLGRARRPPPSSLDEEVARRLMDAMDDGRIGPRARGEVPG